MDCLAFERRLDEGAPDRLPETALAHARACGSCTRSLARARSLERALERHFAAALDPALETKLVALTDRVMARVERGEARGVRWLALPEALPWWVRAAAEPPVALAGALAALLLWRGDALLERMRAWAAGAGPAPVATFLDGAGLGEACRALGGALVAAAGSHWTVGTAFALGLAPLVALLALAMWRAGERLAAGLGSAIAR
jgi:hypothetical protein